MLATQCVDKVCEFGIRARLNVKTVFLRYGGSHVKDKTVARPPYL